MLLLALYPASTLFVFGLIIGSFLNAAAWRLPIMLFDETDSRTTLFFPPSSCTHCQQPIKRYHLIPVVSWLLLRGHCSHCHQPVSALYPLTELLTALLFAAIGWQFADNVDRLFLCAFTALLILLARIDAKTWLLPDALTLPLLWLGLLWHAMTATIAPADAILGAVVGYLSLRGVYHLHHMITGREGMGFGDFKLFAALGAWLGWQALPGVLLIACGLALLLTLLVLITRRRIQSQLPFGPYLTVAGWLMLLLTFSADFRIPFVKILLG